MARVLAYNRKINAPIRFLYYLEVFDLFILLVIGCLFPLFASTFLPVTIPLWHMFLWFGAIFFLLIIIKVGRAPGFVQHWMGKTFRPNSYHPGLKEIEYFRLAENQKASTTPIGGSPFSQIELAEITTSVRKLRQERRESEIMQEPTELL